MKAGKFISRFQMLNSSFRTLSKMKKFILTSTAKVIKNISQKDPNLKKNKNLIPPQQKLNIKLKLNHRKKKRKRKILKVLYVTNF